MVPFELLKEMRHWESDPDVVPYSAAISACEKGVEWMLPFELFKDMRHWELDPDVITCDVLQCSHQCV